MLFALLLMSTGWLAATPAARAMDPRQPFQLLVLDHWGVEQGLPQITVLDMAEEPRGVPVDQHAIGGGSFDGARFTRYDRAGTGVDTSMLDAVWADPRGGVWFGGSRGLIEQRDGRFKALGGAAVDAIIDAGDGTPLLATSEGVQRLREGRIESAGDVGAPAFSLLRDGNHLWVRRRRALLPARRRAGGGNLPVGRGAVAARGRPSSGAAGRPAVAGHVGRPDADRGRAVGRGGAGRGARSAPIESLLADRGGLVVDRHGERPVSPPARWRAGTREPGRQPAAVGEEHAGGPRRQPVAGHLYARPVPGLERLDPTDIAARRRARPAGVERAARPTARWCSAPMPTWRSTTASACAC
ncbi:hypothetical protein SALBM135S_05839 [Streptomyces alboniger]